MQIYFENTFCEYINMPVFLPNQTAMIMTIPLAARSQWVKMFYAVDNQFNFLEWFINN